MGNRQNLVGGVKQVAQYTEQDLRQQVIYYANQLTLSGLAVGTAGNVSTRTSPDDCLITPTGVAYELLQPEDICKVGIQPDASRRDVNSRKPSSETPMHTRIYAERPDVGAIVHTHSLYATACGVAGRPIEAVHYVIATIGDEIPVVPYFLYGSEELAAAVGRAIRHVNGVLLQNHGVMAVGKDLQEAFYHAQTIEYLAQLMYTSTTFGQPRLLSPQQLQEVRIRFRGYGQPRPGQ